MKTVTKLTAQAVEAVWTEPHGVISAVHDEPQPGVLRQLRLGGAGLTFRRGALEVGIPLAELIALFDGHEPAFGELPSANPKSKIAIRKP